MLEGFVVVKFMLVILKACCVLISLLVLLITVGWLRGADNLAFPGLGLIIATPMVIILLAIAEIGVVVAFIILSALAKWPSAG